MLVSRVNDFRNEIREGMVSGDDYHKFLEHYRPFGNSKTQLLEFIQFYFNTKLAVLAIFYGISLEGRTISREHMTL